MKTKEYRIERTRRGFPALWEEGGGYSNTGSALIIAGPDGAPLRPVYIRRRGHLANGNHALFVLRPGMYAVEANHHRGDYQIQVARFTGEITGHDGGPFQDYETAAFEVLYTFDRGEWDAEPPAFLNAAVQAAVEKAACYHCRDPHYADVAASDLCPDAYAVRALLEQAG